MVMGIDWLQTLDEVAFNFTEQKVKITQGQNTWEFIGVHSGTMEVVLAHLLDKTLYQAVKGWVLYMCNQEGKNNFNPGQVCPPQLQALCDEFSSIFENVHSLPPQRTHDHHIPLAPGARLVNQRPYRHPWEQKTIIEKMIVEMLEEGIIKNSQVPMHLQLCWSKKLMALRDCG